VVKIPRFAFEKFPGANTTLTTSMKSVGEAMSVGRTFKEALQKGLRSLESSLAGLETSTLRDLDGMSPEELRRRVRTPTAERILYMRRALEAGVAAREVAELSQIDPWFVDNLAEIVEEERALAGAGVLSSREAMLDAKRAGFSDVQLARLSGADEGAVREARHRMGVRPAYKLVDTCAAEFEAGTPYYYSTYESESECRPTAGRKVMILGSGPNRIGQGIEFDYCCVHAAFALRELGCESIMVNSNPETVSTDYDTSDRLYFEPLTLEDVLEIVRVEEPEGVLIQFGGQTPLKLALPLERAGVRVLGTQPSSIHLAEDRGSFNELIRRLGMKQPAGGTARSPDEARALAERLGYPVLVRPSYVLGGRAMAIIPAEDELGHFVEEAIRVGPEHPVLVDKFLEDAIEVDVDAVSDGTDTRIGGVMEHVEEAGVHSGDATCVLPPHTLSPGLVDEMARVTRRLAKELDVRGLMNVQFAVRHGEVFILEVNPRASRTVPFASKATGVPLAKVATKVSMGMSLAEAGFPSEVEPDHFAVKVPVFPFNRFPGASAELGPEMKSTGEVMAIAPQLGVAMAKALIAAGVRLPTRGGVFVSVNDADKRAVIPVARRLRELGLDILSTGGTARVLARNGVPTQKLPRIHEGLRPNVLDLMKDGRVGMLVNTVSGLNPRRDERLIRSEAIARGIPVISTVSGAQAVVDGIASLMRDSADVIALQDCFAGAPAG
jgi:carbamoyl-phosphate synthase large subunit